MRIPSVNLLLILSILLFGCITAYGQLDTSNLVANKWVNIWPATSVININGGNGNYENDFNGDPFFGFLVMGPGHVIHPQDCNFYPYNPLTNKWYKIDPPFKMPRTCISTFCLSSQDSAIIWQYGAEGGHQMSQGKFDASYSSITPAKSRGIQIAVYSFNRNRWYDMAGPHTLPPTIYHQRVRYDPVHDITIRPYGSQIWVYNFHTNNAKSYSGGQSGSRAATVDTKRGLLYYMSGGSIRVFNPETGTSTTGALSGNQPLSISQYDVESMDYDPLHDVILFLSDASCPATNVISTTWAFHCDTRVWEELDAADCPPNRGRLAFNRSLNSLVMLGGGGDCGAECLSCPGGMWAYRYKAGFGIQTDMVRQPYATLDSRGGTIRLNWENLTSSGADGYIVYRGEGDPFPHGFVKLAQLSVSDTSYTDASAISGHAYSYRICGIKAGVDGHLSRHLYTRPARVLDVVASIEDSSRICISWERRTEPDITGYDIYRAKGASIYAVPMSGYEKLNTLPVQDTFFNDLTANYTADQTARGYIVRAINAFACTSGLSDVGTTFPKLPERTWTIGQSTAQGLKMALRWQPPARTRIIGVNLYRGNGFEKQNTSGLITDTGATFWNMPPSTGGTGYELAEKTYIVRAVNIYGQEGFNSDQISPTNSDFGPGIAMPSERFNYNLFRGAAISVENSRQPETNLVLKVWPNPFNPLTHIEFYAPLQGISAAVFDVQGRQVLDLTSSIVPGKHNQLTWDAKNSSGVRVASGVYVVRLSAGLKVLNKKVFFIR